MCIKGLLLLLAASSLSAGRILPQPERRIVGGQDTNIEQAPWQVSLRYDGYHLCGGSIFSETIIITAAHCLYDADNTRARPEDLEILAGSTDNLCQETLVKVAAIQHHMNYHTTSLENDIAVVKLREPLDLTTKKMQKIALANEDPAAGTKALVTGWGRVIKYVEIDQQLVNVMQYYPNILQGVFVEIQDCKNLRLKVPKGFICAKSAGYSACNEDSGGPLVVNNTLVGVVSYGDSTCNLESVYTSVFQFRKWIIETAESM